MHYLQNIDALPLIPLAATDILAGIDMGAYPVLVIVCFRTVVHMMTELLDCHRRNYSLLMIPVLVAIDMVACPLLDYLRRKRGLLVMVRWEVVIHTNGSLLDYF
jgi:uncharacterized protein (DUF983 family)